MQLKRGHLSVEYKGTSRLVLAVHISLTVECMLIEGAVLRSVFKTLLRGMCATNSMNLVHFN